MKYPENVTFICSYGMGKLGFFARFKNCWKLMWGVYLDDVHMTYTREEIEKAMEYLKTPIKE